MKRFAMTVVLACALSGTALAGDVPSTGIVSPPPPPPDQTVEFGNQPTTDSTSPGDVPAIDLSILLTVLNLAF